MLDGEYEWLSAVVDNLADDNTKLVYADWLEEQGDSARAKFLRAFVAAAKTMTASDFPEPKPKFKAEWLDLIGHRLLSWLAAVEVPELKQSWLKLARPALRVNKKPMKDAKLIVGTSKFGGSPDLPKGYTWPKGKECNAIYNDDTKGVEALAGFLAQVNFAEIAHTQATRHLPKKGLLSFFAFQDIENDRPDVIGAKAIWFPDTTRFVRTKPPGELTAGNRELSPQRLTFEEALDLPEDYSSPWSSELRLDENVDLSFIADEIREGNFENMLGYGRATSGDDPTPDKKHRHLIMLKNSVDCRLHIQIHEKDLKALKFDKIKLVWVDFD